MKICGFVFLICLFLTPSFAYAEFKSCQDKIAGKKSISVLIGMSKMELDNVGVNGAENDVMKFKTITQAMNEPDEVVIIQPLQKDLEEDNIKEKIMKQLLDLKKNNPRDAEFDLMYSGHGILCLDPLSKIQHWCLVAGMKNIKKKGMYNVLTQEEKENYFIVDDQMYPKKNLITETEIMNTLGPKSMLLDSCHTGKASEVILNSKNSIGPKKGAFVFASALSGQLAADQLSGGYLTSTLYNMVEKFDDKAACLMDWEGNGEISERALVVASMLAFIPSTTKVKELDKNAVVRDAADSDSHKLADGKYQMVAANPVGACAMKHTAKCGRPATLSKEGVNQCEYLGKKNSQMAEQINIMMKERAIFRRFVPDEFKFRDELGLISKAELESFPGGSSVPKDSGRGLRLQGSIEDEKCTNCHLPENRQQESLSLFFKKFKEDLISEYSDVCREENPESLKCTSLQHQETLNVIDLLFLNSKEILFQQKK